MGIDAATAIRIGAEGLELVGRLWEAIKRARETGDVSAMRDVGDVLDRDDLRSREMLRDAELAVTMMTR